MGTTWRQEIGHEMSERGESWDDVVHVTLGAHGGLDVEFDPGYGATKGCPFTLWTKNRVYFPACYDGAEWVESVPRNPRVNEATEHVGGG